MHHSCFKIERFDEIDSTNTQLKQRAFAGAPCGTVLVADAQTAGRGRMGRSFFSPRGSGLYLSVLLRPVDFSDAGHLTTLTAVAVARALEAVGVSTEIKWINDLLAGGKKLCGILVEGGTVDGESFAVIGIGVNLRQTAFPEELADIATSAEEQIGKIPHRDTLVNEILSEIHKIHIEKREDVPTLMNEYRARCRIAGRRVRVSPLSGAPFEAIALAVENDGALTVRPLVPENATPVTLSSAEISVRPVAD